MPTLNYWNQTTQRWERASPDRSDPTNIPATGGTVTGPLPVTIDAANDTYDLISHRPITAITYTTTRTGSVNTSIILQNRSVDLGGAEIEQVTDNASTDSGDAVTKGTVDDTLATFFSERLNLTPHYWKAVRDEEPSFPVPTVHRDREGMVILSGTVCTDAVISAANPYTRVIGIVSKFYRPIVKASFASFCLGGSVNYCRIDVTTEGSVVYAEGPDIPPLTYVILDGSSYYTS